MKQAAPKEILASLRDTVSRLDNDQSKQGPLQSHVALRRLLNKRIAELEAALEADSLPSI